MIKKSLLVVFCLALILLLSSLIYSAERDRPPTTVIGNNVLRNFGTICNSDSDCASGEGCSSITNEFIYFPLTLAADVSGVCVTRDNWVGSCGAGSTCNSDLTGCSLGDTNIVCNTLTYCKNSVEGVLCAFKKAGGISCSHDNECASNECGAEGICTGERSDDSAQVALPSISIVQNSECTADKTIFKVSSLTNAHASLWEDNTYQYSVCNQGVVPANPHECINNQISSSIIESIMLGAGARFGGDFSINKLLSLSSATNAHTETKIFNYALLDNYGNGVCYGSLFCTTREGSCDAGASCMVKLSSATNAHVSSCSDSNYPISLCCSDISALTADFIGDAAPQSCNVNTDCNQEGAVCRSFSAPNPGPGLCMIPPDTWVEPDGEVPDTGIPGTGVPCTTINQCGDNEACFLNAGAGGYCDVCDSASTADIDGDGILDCSGEDPCVGSSDPGCFDDDLGLSCSAIDGIVCGQNENCDGEVSNQATELNCCVSSDETTQPGCESASVFFAEAGVSVQFNKQCTSDGRTQVEAIVMGGGIRLNVAEANAKLNLLGFDTSRGNPYIDNTDYSCANINLGAATEGAEIPGYGLISILLSLSLLFIFYAANRKLLKS